MEKSLGHKSGEYGVDFEQKITNMQRRAKQVVYPDAKALKCFSQIALMVVILQSVLTNTEHSLEL